MRRDVFQAIADPTRRDIINLISQRSLNLHSVVSHFDVSRPAIAKHMKILEECGLIMSREQGREKFYTAQLSSLNEVSEWVERYRVFWAGKLDALDKFLNEKQTDHHSRTKRKIQPKRKKK